MLVHECNYDWLGSCRKIWMNPRAKANFQGYVYGPWESSIAGGMFWLRWNRLAGS